MVIKSVNEILYGVKTDIPGSKNAKRVVVESGIKGEGEIVFRE